MKKIIRNIFLKIRRRIAPTHFELLGAQLRQLAKDMPTPVRVLDIGAGSAWYWRSGPLGDLVNVGAIALTILEPSSECGTPKELKATRLSGIAPDDLRLVKSDSFHVVMAFDVIEHLPKDQGYLLLYEMERLSSELAVVFTPNGWIWQPPSANNAFNAHISGWQPNEFKKRAGWSVTGHHGPKWAFGPYGRARELFTKNFFGSAMLELLSLLIRSTPSRAYSFLAVSRKEKRAEPELQPNVCLKL